LVVSDVVMPEMDGPTLMKELKKRDPEIKIIFVSGYAEDAFDKSLPDHGQFNFLPKPFTLKQLVTAVEETKAGKGSANPGGPHRGTPRVSPARRARYHRAMSDPEPPKQSDCAETERDRRTANLVLLLFFVVLVVAGIWLVNAMVEQRTIDDCVAQGR